MIFGQKFIYSKIEWDETFVNQIIALEEDFWNGCVVPKRIPLPDGSDSSSAVLEAYFRESDNEGAVTLTTDMENKLDRRQAIAEKIKQLEQEKTQIEQEVKLFMDGHSFANSERYQVSWQMVDSQRVNTKKLKAEQPEIYKKYLQVNQSSRFTVQVA